MGMECTRDIQISLEVRKSRFELSPQQLDLDLVFPQHASSLLPRETYQAVKVQLTTLKNFHRNVKLQLIHLS